MERFDEQRLDRARDLVDEARDSVVDQVNGLKELMLMLRALDSELTEAKRSSSGLDTQFTLASFGEWVINEITPEGPTLVERMEISREIVLRVSRALEAQNVRSQLRAPHYFEHDSGPSL